MTGNLKWRAAGVAAAVLLFGFYTLANFVSKPARIDNPLLPDEGLRLGLDLQGGIHWVLGVELAASVKHELEALGDRVEDVLEDTELSAGEISVANGELRIEAVGEAARAAVSVWAKDTGVLTAVSEDPPTYRLTDAWTDSVKLTDWWRAVHA